jgi:hypothetical protein
MNDQHSTVTHPIAKFITAWVAAIGVSSWSDFAAMLAAIYTLLLVGEWLWKRVGRPFCEARGWVKRPKRRRDDPQD